MGMREETEHIDLLGLPVFKTTKIKKERVGDEIHMVCGYEMFGQTIWTHISIMSAADLAAEAVQCTQIAMRPPKQATGLATAH